MTLTESFLESFYLSLFPWAGMGAGVWFVLQCQRAITPSLMRREKGCVWTRITPHLNRRLGGTFLAPKLLSLAIPALFQSNIFLAILGYMDLSQHCGWCMRRRTSDFFFNWLKRNGDKCGSEQVLKCGWKWKCSDVKRIRHSSWEWCLIFFRMKGMEKCGYIVMERMEQYIRGSARPSTDRREEVRPRSHVLSLRLSRSI